MKTPLIGVSANLMPAGDRPLYKGKALLYAERAMLDAVLRAGGVPVVLPIVSSAREVRRVLDGVDGVIISGGADVSPRWYGERPKDPRWAGQPERDECELALVRGARRRERPLLGICRGHQLLNVACDGALWQDVGTMRDRSRIHRDAEVYDDLSHRVTVLPRTRVAALLGKSGKITVNSIHHQGVKRLGRGLVPVAFAPDGLIEAIEIPGDRLTVGVQWHPEWMRSREQRRLFHAFVCECAK